MKRLVVLGMSMVAMGAYADDWQSNKFEVLVGYSSNSQFDVECIAGCNSPGEGYQQENADASPFFEARYWYDGGWGVAVFASETDFTYASMSNAGGTLESIPVSGSVDVRGLAVLKKIELGERFSASVSAMYSRIGLDQTFSGISASTSDNDLGFAIGVGYEINENFGLELAHKDFGTLEGGLNSDWSTNSLSLSYKF